VNFLVDFIADKFCFFLLMNLRLHYIGKKKM